MMAWILLGMMMLLCVRSAEGLSANADITVSVMEAGDSDTALNTSHMGGVFSSESLTGPVAGQLVHVHSEGGNNYGCDDYIHEVPTHNWVALIERGECRFSLKVNIAIQRYNAAAVIVYNNQPSNRIYSRMLVGGETGVHVFVHHWDGKRLAQLVDSGLQVQVKITDLSASRFTTTEVPSLTTVTAISKPFSAATVATAKPFSPLTVTTAKAPSTSSSHPQVTTAKAPSSSSSHPQVTTAKAPFSSSSHPQLTTAKAPSSSSSHPQVTVACPILSSIVAILGLYVVLGQCV